MIRSAGQARGLEGGGCYCRQPQRCIWCYPLLEDSFTFQASSFPGDRRKGFRQANTRAHRIFRYEDPKHDRECAICESSPSTLLWCRQGGHHVCTGCWPRERGSSVQFGGCIKCAWFHTNPAYQTLDRSRVTRAGVIMPGCGFFDPFPGKNTGLVYDKISKDRHVELCRAAVRCYGVLGRELPLVFGRSPRDDVRFMEQMGEYDGAAGQAVIMDRCRCFRQRIEKDFRVAEDIRSRRGRPAWRDLGYERVAVPVDVILGPRATAMPPAAMNLNPLPMEDVARLAGLDQQIRDAALTARNQNESPSLGMIGMWPTRTPPAHARVGNVRLPPVQGPLDAFEQALAIVGAAADETFRLPKWKRESTVGFRVPVGWALRRAGLGRPLRAGKRRAPPLLDFGMGARRSMELLTAAVSLDPFQQILSVTPGSLLAPFNLREYRLTPQFYPTPGGGREPRSRETPDEGEELDTTSESSSSEDSTLERELPPCGFVRRPSLLNAWPYMTIEFGWKETPLEEGARADRGESLTGEPEDEPLPEGGSSSHEAFARRPRSERGSGESGDRSGGPCRDGPSAASAAGASGRSPGGSIPQDDADRGGGPGRDSPSAVSAAGAFGGAPRGNIPQDYGASASRATTPGEMATAGIGVQAGSGRGGGSGNGTNPAAPHFLTSERLTCPMLVTKGAGREGRSDVLAEYEELSLARWRQNPIEPHLVWEKVEALLALCGLPGPSGAWAPRDTLFPGGPIDKLMIARGVSRLRDFKTVQAIRLLRERCRKPDGTSAAEDAALGWLRIRCVELRCKLGAELFFHLFEDRVRLLIEVELSLIHI